MTTEAGTSPRAAAGAKPTHGLDTAVRVSVTGPAGHADLVVPFGSDLADVAASYAAALGGPVPAALARPGGTPLDPAAEVSETLDHGDLLVVADTGSAAPEQGTAPAGSRLGSTSLAGGSAAPVLVLAALSALAAAVATALGVGASGGTLPATRWVVAAVLAVGALLVALRTARVGTSRGQAHAVGPALAAAAGYAVAWSPGPGGAILALGVAGLCAAVAAAVARTGADDDAGEQVLRSWLTGGGVLGAVAVGWLLLGAGSVALAVVALAVAVVAVRTIPGFVVDVDDDVLLDLDRLAVTAWSARETPRGGRKRHQVRPSMVRDVVARSRRAVLAGVVVSCATAATAAPVVVLGGALDEAATTWTAAGDLALVALAGCYLGLAGRGFRSRLPRRLLGLTSAWLVLLSGAVLASGLEGGWVWWAFAAMVVVVPAVVLAGVRLGHGWRSVWWARAGEVVETLCGVGVLALVPLATGLFEVIRTSFG